MQNDNMTDPFEAPPSPPAVKLIPMKAQGPVPIPESRFGERLKHARDDLDLSIEALSRLSKNDDPSGHGVSPTSIARYESGGGMPGLVEFRILCDALAVPAQWLLYGDIGNAGKDELEQEYLAALTKIIKAKSAEDRPSADAELNAHFKNRDRAEALAKARKPKG